MVLRQIECGKVIGSDRAKASNHIQEQIMRAHSMVQDTEIDTGNAIWGNRIGGPPCCGLLRITKDMALDALRRNTKNRKIHNERAAEILHCMTEGSFMLVPDMIAFDCTGTLINGQKRLLALILSDLPHAEFFVAWNLKPDAFLHCDEQQRRTPKFSLAAMGTKLGTVDAAAIRGFYELPYKVCRQFPAERIRRAANILGSILTDTMSMPRTGEARLKCGPIMAAYMRALAHIRVELSAAEETRLREFCTMFTDGSAPDKFHYIRRLHDSVLKASSWSGREDRIELYQVTTELIDKYIHCIPGFKLTRKRRHAQSKLNDIFPIPKCFHMSFPKAGCDLNVLQSRILSGDYSTVDDLISADEEDNEDI